MADNLVRLGLAFTVIIMVTASLYSANVRRAVAFEPATISLTR